MSMRALAAVAAVLGLAGAAGAGGLTPVTSVTVAPAVGGGSGPLDLEWLRSVGPQMGRNVAVPTAGGGVLRTIEWHRDIEVRVRTETGVPLTAGERAGVLGLLRYCDRGEVRSPTERVERNGTFVVEYDCTWLQGVQ